ncbi:MULTISPECIES: hypothetical protein [unclassified Saccharopolyspora]|nr:MULTISPECIES: hypothetical protein [unclassified Saccharopolyspora]MCA1185490.1 hypothetical protein [Saccharopolyspora sp. 6T]MCA1192287.1 hypothetical protein [Saccharopolyspora sp. 6V]MCA1225169.1 hypothetical protein [Saccharopolyspora sp. 6M]MCA1279592.1 hypothetical protein [Saccharopolyspora sp. 7B]
MVVRPSGSALDVVREVTADRLGDPGAGGVGRLRAALVPNTDGESGIPG